MRDLIWGGEPHCGSCEKRFIVPPPGLLKPVCPSVCPESLLTEQQLPPQKPNPGETHPETSEPNRSINHGQLEGGGAAHGSAVNPQQLVTPGQDSLNPCDTQQGGRGADLLLQSGISKLVRSGFLIQLLVVKGKEPH